MVVDPSDPLAYVLASLAMMGCLVLAWRGWRHASREDRARKQAIRRRTGR
jgi:hypothetical protein